jgi:tetratricopeptide (TPR) repeat protein
MLFPILGFFHQAYHVYSWVADQWLYPAMIGVLALAAAAAVNIWRRFSVRFRYVEIVAGVAVFVMLSVATWNRNQVFASQETLWRDTMERNPQSWLAFNNLGVVLGGQGKLDEAIALYRRALQLKPDYLDAYDNLGGALAAEKKYDNGRLPEYLTDQTPERPGAQTYGRSLLARRRIPAGNRPMGFSLAN